MLKKHGIPLCKLVQLVKIENLFFSRGQNSHNNPVYLFIFSNFVTDRTFVGRGPWYLVNERTAASSDFSRSCQTLNGFCFISPFDLWLPYTAMQEICDTSRGWNSRAVRRMPKIRRNEGGFCLEPNTTGLLFFAL